MDISHAYWEENSNLHRVKYERCSANEEPVRIKDDSEGYQCCDSNLNFSTATCSEDDCEYGPYKKSKVARQDPMSHRIIEKRRRDRMNNCLADLSRLIPTEYLKKGRGRIEKTEIIEMAIKHMKHLQQQDKTSPWEHYRLGYQECMSEAMRFIVKVEGLFPRELVNVRLLNHLQKHCEQISKGHPGFLGPEQAIPFPPEFPKLVEPDQSKSCEFNVPKAEPENGDSNDAHVVKSKSEFDKEDANHGVASYKYKTNIKLRFNQDLNAHEVPKNLENGRRNSITSFENQSSNQSSTLSTETGARTSDNETGNRRTPPNGKRKLEISHPRVSSVVKTQPLGDNFNVPVFVLHAKGSYYVPLTIDYKTLLPYLQNYDILDVPAVPNIVLHPVTINVNFVPNLNGILKPSHYKYEYNNNWR